MSAKFELQAAIKKLQDHYRHPPTMTIQEFQALTSARGRVRGGVWISQDTFRAPKESDLKDAVYSVIEKYQTPMHVIPTRDSVELKDVPFEWIGQRKRVGPKEAQPELPDSVIYGKLCDELEEPMTILYAHGGAFYVGSPTFSRPSTTKLAKLTKSRVVSVAYRLGPQDPFPAGLLDLATAWMSILYPADNARHAPVSPESVVLAGDSAGTSLCLALVQTLLQLKATCPNNKVKFNGRCVNIPLPAGVAVLSLWIDLSNSLPSWQNNAKTDFLPAIQQGLQPEQSQDEVWPANPPRGDFYCHQHNWTHPLVSPVLAENWHGSPPMWIATGEERCADAAKVLATRAAQQGVFVMFSEYQGLPHIFPVVLPALPQSQRCYQDWARFCLECCQKQDGRVNSRGTLICATGNQVGSIDVQNMSAPAWETVVQLVAKAALKRRPWLGTGSKL